MPLLQSVEKCTRGSRVFTREQEKLAHIVFFVNMPAKLYNFKP